MKRSMPSTRNRASATLLAVVTLWLASSTAFAAAPRSHACPSEAAGATVIAPSASHSASPCQHTGQIGCPRGWCAGPAMALSTPNASAGEAPGATLEAPAAAILPTGPRSAPPTPPPNS